MRGICAFYAPNDFGVAAESGIERPSTTKPANLVWYSPASGVYISNRPGDNIESARRK
jgi:hypothetical protein